MVVLLDLRVLRELVLLGPSVARGSCPPRPPSHCHRLVTKGAFVLGVSWVSTNCTAEAAGR